MIEAYYSIHPWLLQASLNIYQNCSFFCLLFESFGTEIVFFETFEFMNAPFTSISEIIKYKTGVVVCRTFKTERLYYSTLSVR